MDREIHFVDCMEIPDISPWLHKNELMITTGYSIKNDPEACLRLLRELNQVGAAGIALKTRYIGEITQSMIDTANELGLPMIELPQEIAFIDVITPIMKEIVNNQNRQLELSLQISERFIATGLKSDGFSSMAETLVEIIHRPVAIFNADFTLITAALSGQSNIDASFEEMLCLIKKTPPQFVVEKINDRLERFQCSNGFQVLRQKIFMKNSICGYIIVSAPETFDELYTIALYHAANGVGIEFSKLETKDKNERIFDNNLFIDLLTKNFKYEEEAVSRCKMLRWPNLPFVIGTLDIVKFERHIEKMQEEEILQLKSQITKFIRSFFSAYDIRLAVVSKSDSFTIITPDFATHLEAVYEKLIKVIQNQFLVEVTAGISNPCMAYLDFEQHYNETRDAIKIARGLRHKSSVLNINDVLLERDLLHAISDGYLAGYSRKILNPIIEYDRLKQTNLLELLEVYTNNLGKKNTTSRELFLHRNTLSFKLNKIEELLALDLCDSKNIIKLHAAIKFYKLSKQCQ